MDQLTPLLNTYLAAKNKDQPDALNTLLAAMISAINTNSTACTSWGDKLSGLRHELIIRKK